MNYQGTAMQFLPRTPRFAIGTLMLSTAALCLSACTHRPLTEDVPPPQIVALESSIPLGDVPENMLDWPGTYQAVLPCNGCAGTAISVQLRLDRTAVVRERALGGPSDQPMTPTYSGAFRFDPPGGSLITLKRQPSDSAAYRFFVGEGWIEMRERATGAALSQRPLYRLRKTSEMPQ